MPTYVYRCKECEHQFEIVQRMSDNPLTECPECKGQLRKVMFPVGIAFKGSGFHVNDYPSSKSTATTPASAPAPTSTPSTKKEDIPKEPAASAS